MGTLGMQLQILNFSPNLDKKAFQESAPCDKEKEIMEAFECDFMKYSAPLLHDLDNGLNGAEKKCKVLWLFQ